MSPAFCSKAVQLPGWRKPPVLTYQFTSPDGYPVSLYTLSNGHRVIIEQRPADIVSLRTFVNTGSIVENPVFNSPLYRKTGFPSGIAHLDEHCHFLATQNFPEKNRWTATVEKLGANFNASTGNEMIQHEITFNREDLPSVLGLHAEQVLRPLYKAEDLDQEKTNVINEMAQRMAPPESKVFSKLSELLFDRPGFQTLGEKEDVLNTTVEQLQRFHHTFYTPTNMVTVVSGRVDPNMVLSIADREFGSNPARVQPPNAATGLALRPSEIRHATIQDPQLTYSMVNLGFPAPARANIQERVAMEFLVTLLGDGPLSMLETEVKQNRRLATAIGVDYEPMKAAGTLGIFLETSPSQEQQALSAMLETVGNLSRWQVSPEKLAEVRDKLIHKFKSDISDVETASHIMGDELLHQSLPYYLNYIQLVNSIKPDDLLNVARKYLNPQSYAVVFGVPGQQQPSVSLQGGVQ